MCDMGRMQAIRRIIIAGFFAFTAPAFAQTAESQDQNDYTSEVLPYGLETVHERIALLFDSDARDFYEDYPWAIYDLPEHAQNINSLSSAAYRKFIAFPLVRSNKFYVFFGAYPNMQGVLQAIDQLSVMGQSNAALQRYALLPKEAREQDFYLWSPDAPYWYSEYNVNGKPVPFHSYFIVHLSAIDNAHTQVEMIEDQPVVQMGRRLSVDLHGHVNHFDIRPVDPTSQDRVFMLSCIRQFIQRKVPGRHWFNCKDKAAEKAAENAPVPVPFTVP